MTKKKKIIPEEVLQFYEESLPILQKYDLLPSKKRDSTLIVILAMFVLLISFTATVYYLGVNDKFKSNQDVNVQPQVDVNPVTNNNYSFATPVDVENKYNQTIINNIYINNCSQG